jgi:hypothetical protein
VAGCKPERKALRHLLYFHEKLGVKMLPELEGVGRNVKES